MDLSYYSGYMKATRGSATQMTGDLLGWKEWSTSGAKAHAEGNAEMSAATARAKVAEAQQAAQKTGNQVTAAAEQANGYLTSVRGAVLGDKKLNAEGMAAQRAAELKRKANAF